MAAFRQVALRALRAITPSWVPAFRGSTGRFQRAEPASERAASSLDPSPTPLPLLHLVPPASPLPSVEPTEPPAGVTVEVLTPLERETAAAASEPSVVDPLIGQLLLGRYSIREHIRLAGTSDVYLAVDNLAVDQTGPKEVAIKIARTDHYSFSPDQCVQILLWELDVLGRLRHPNIVELIDSGLHGDRIFLVLEYLPGLDLYEAMPTERDIREMPRTPGEVYARWEYGRYVVCELCDTLEATHAMGIIHRDLKPSNVRLLPSPFLPRVKLMDFGLAKPIDEPFSAHPAHMPDSVEGTPAYLAPEQIGAHLRRSQRSGLSIGRRPPYFQTPLEYDHRIDLYSLGVILYEFLCGRAPFLGLPSQVLLAHLEAEPPSPSALRPDFVIPADVEALVLRLLEKDPDQRFASAAEVKAALVACGSVRYKQ